MRFLMLILVPVILIFCMALFLLWMPLPSSFPAPFSHARNLPAAIITGILSIGYLAGLAVYGTASFLRAGHVLDSILLPLGLTAQNNMLWGRKYHGIAGRRQVDIDYMPARGIWPALLNIYVGAAWSIRAAIGRQRPLLDCRDCPAANPDRLAFQVFTRDEKWLYCILGKPGNEARLTRLLSDQETLGFREIYLQPGRLWLRAHPCRPSINQCSKWLDDLIALADAVEQSSESISDRPSN